MPSNHLIRCHPFLLLPSIFPSISTFSKESAVDIRWPEYWSFNFSISPSKEYSGLISFKIDWFDRLAFQGTLESSPTPQIESINYSVLCLLYCPALIPVHDNWKDHSLDYRDVFVSKVMSFHFNTLRIVVAFLPGGKHLLISWHSHHRSDFRAKKRESVTASNFSPSICHEVMGPDIMILVF